MNQPFRFFVLLRKTQNDEFLEISQIKIFPTMFNKKNKKIPKHLERGLRGENFAADFLKKQNLKILERNFRTRRGEIDLIAQDAEVLVFVEVRMRQKNSLVSAAESINTAKQAKWKIAATEYLAQKFPSPPDCRFDAILITADGDNFQDIEWIKGLFL